MKPTPVLLVTQSEEIKKIVTLGLFEHYGEHLQLRRVNVVEDSLTTGPHAFHPELVIIEQNPLQCSHLKTFLEKLPHAEVILVSTVAPAADELKTIETSARFVLSIELGPTLPVILKKYETIGKIKSYGEEDDYVPIDATRILKMNQMPTDVYLKSPSGAYIKVYRKSDHVIEPEIVKYTGQTFYLVKADCQKMFKDHVKRIEETANENPIDIVKAKKIAEISQDLVRSLVAQIGFTEEVQQIAKTSVALSIKTMGSKPRLAKIIQELKKKEGNFVTSHSFLLGQLSCAMAYSVGWKSQPTFFKLSMAAFLHDIALNINTVEQELSLEEAEKSMNYTGDELKILKFHPSKAAEYTRQFSEIPADVEQIVAQHHERADGTGYPRGLSAKYISPLSALFIIAHDLIIFMTKHPEAKPELFYEMHEKDYQQASFKKTFQALMAEKTQKEPF